ncbi:MAG: hypothetical protein ACLFSE_14950, partial [Spirochaetia bacterium]
MMILNLTAGLMIFFSGILLMIAVIAAVILAVKKTGTVGYTGKYAKMIIVGSAASVIQITLGI